MLAEGGDPWNWLNLLLPVGLALVGAILGVWLRMEIAVAKQTERMNFSVEDRRNLWAAITAIREDNEECSRERGGLKTSVDSLKERHSPRRGT